MSAKFPHTNKPFAPIRLDRIRAARAYIPNQIEGLAHPVFTWERPLRWETVEFPADPAAADHARRDEYKNRSALCVKLALKGKFEYAIAYAPKLEDNNANNGKKNCYAVKCALCGAGHNWCAFYRDAETGEYLGHSGVVCFDEVLQNLSVPHREKVLEVAMRVKSRSEQIAATMRKINDFCADFPGIFDMREDLCDTHKNPYARIFQEAMQFLNDARGVSEEVLLECQAGKFDRTYRKGVYDYKVGYRRSVEVVDQSARRLPELLMWTRDSFKTLGNKPGDVLEALVEMAGKEATDSLFYRAAVGGVRDAGVSVAGTSLVDTTPIAVPNASVPFNHNPNANKPVAPVVAAPAPVVAPKLAAVPVANATGKDYAVALLALGTYGWSNVVAQAAAGKTVSTGSLKFLQDKYQFEANKNAAPSSVAAPAPVVTTVAAPAARPAPVITEVIDCTGE